MKFSQIIGQNGAVEQIQTAYRSGRMHHALLLTGPDGVGKRTLARVLANTVLCGASTDDEPCMHCGACLRYAQGTHADFVRVGLETRKDGTTEKAIKVEQIRELQKSLSLKPFEGGGRVVLITDADSMNSATSNALLKTLEEPPPETMFILTSSTPSALLPTIVSRCQILRLSPLNERALRELAEQHLECGEDALQSAIPLSGGSFSRLVLCLDNDFREVQRDCRERILAIRSGVDQACVLEFSEKDAADKKKERPNLVLDILGAWYRSYLVMLHGDTREIDPQMPPPSSQNKTGEIITFLRLIEKIRQGLRNNQRNPRLALEEVWFMVAEMERNK